MHAVVVVVGLALVFVGSALERRPGGFDHAKAVGLSLFLLGEVLLFTEGWWWGLIGLAVPPIPIHLLLGGTPRR